MTSVSVTPQGTVASGGSVELFSPDNGGQVAANGDLVSAFKLVGNPTANTSANAGTRIWVEVTSGEATIYCSCDSGGSDGTAGLEVWNDDTGTGQGDPGTYSSGGTAVFTLGAEPDSIRITKSNETTFNDTGIGETSSASVSQIGSFTDNSFFTPSLSTDYGYRADTSASDTNDNSVNVDAGAQVDVTFTFRKTGNTDYSITYTQDADSTAYKGAFGL